MQHIVVVLFNRNNNSSINKNKSLLEMIYDDSFVHQEQTNKKKTKALFLTANNAQYLQQNINPTNIDIRQLLKSF